jgi:GT2 family glycosyltransferase
VSRVAWLSDRVLLIAGSFPLGANVTFDTAAVDYPKHAGLLDFRIMSMEGFAAPGLEMNERSWLMVAVAPATSSARQSAGSRSIWADGNSATVESARMADCLTDLRTLVRETFAPLDVHQRHRVIEFLVDSTSTTWSPAAPGNGSSNVSRGKAEESVSANHLAQRLRLSKGLHIVREMLRERSRRCELKHDHAQGLAVEAMLAIDETAFYIDGWLCDVEAPLVRLTAVSPEGERIELLDKVVRYPRPDVQEYFAAAMGQIEAHHGFLAYFNSRTPSMLANGWVVEMEAQSGDSMEERAPVAISDVNRIRELVLNDMDHDPSADQGLLRKHIAPAMSRLQDRCVRRVHLESVSQYGGPPRKPQVSIVIPLYRRIDFLEHQMAQFAHDPEIQGADLIYVLDSPEMAKELEAQARRLFRLYKVPFRVLILSHTGGYSTANNIGSDQARGDLLMLVNSDVLPERPGWLSKMVTFYRSLDHPGAVGAKLIYEDDSLQHAGLYFDRPLGSSVWSNEHYHKGLHRDLPDADVARPVSAVSAACLMIETELFRSVGGLSGHYVQGDYEDSDLCLRLYAEGRKNWYFPGSVLYHLEGQSYPSTMRRLHRDYNQWLFNATWGPAIEASAEAFDRYGRAVGTRETQAVKGLLPNDVPVSVTPTALKVARQRKARNGNAKHASEPPAVISKS